MFGWIKRTFRNALTNLTGIENPASWFANWVNRHTSDAGVTVNAETTIGWAPVWYAVSKIAGHVSTLPLTVHRRLESGGAEKAVKHPAYRLLRTRPNPFTTAAHFKETLMVHSLLYGNGKAAIIRSAGRPYELLLIDPSASVTAFVGGEKFHGVRLDDDERLRAVDGTDGSREEPMKWLIIPDRDVLHVPGLSLDGTVGLEIFTVASGPIGLGLATDKMVSKDFANGSRPGIILQAPRGVLSDPKDASEFVRAFDAHHSGVDNEGKTGMLRDGITAVTLEKGNNQWVEQRLFQRQEVALLFQLESILGDDDSVSYGSAEQKDLAYLKNCLMRWLVRIEQECDEKLLSRRQKLGDTHYFKFNTAALLRSDFSTTIAALGVAIVHRIMNPNEAREKLDMNPYEGGDEFFNPAITPGTGDDESGTEAAKTTPEEANNRAIVSHLRHQIGIECKRIVGAVGNKRNLAGYIEAFYKGWETTLGNSIEEFGGDRQAATDYCDASKSQILAVLQTVPIDGLAGALEELTAKWPDRADALATTILGELIDV